jgi:hypothetical protein
VQVSTPHFNVYADVSLARAEQHARELEQLLTGLQETGWDYHGKLPLKLNVVMLRDPRDFARYAGPDDAGYFVEAVLFEPWAVLPAPRKALDLHVLAHELSHHLAYLALRNQPLWFSEGLATYYETARLDDEGYFVLGTPPAHHHALLWKGGVLPAAKLFDPQRKRSPELYASGWLLVHYLMMERGDEFVRYQDELARGQPHDRAWRAAFPGLSYAALDALLLEYLQQDSYQVLSVVGPKAESSLSSRQLSVADEEALRAVLWNTCYRLEPAARAAKVRYHLERALALDPKQVDARLLLGFADVGAAGSSAYFQQLTRDFPLDYRTWLGFALASEGAAAYAVEKAIALAPQQPATWWAAAQHQSRAGDHAAALASAERGLRLRPTNAVLLGLYAQLLLQAKRCAELDAIVTRIDLLERDRLDLRQREQLGQMRMVCAAQAQN